jgi:hypothetical protein
MMTRRFRWLVPVALLGLGLAACPTDDDGGPPGGTADSGRDGSTGSDGATADAALPAELFGEYDFVSVSYGGLTITTTNRDLGGSRVRADGSLSLSSDGAYSRVLEFYADDELSETEAASGTWSVASPGVVTINEEGSEAFNARYAFAGGTLTLTRTTDGGPTLDVEELVYDKR